MMIGRVAGEIHSTINHPFYDGEKLLLVDKVAPDGSLTGDYLVATDRADAGVGEVVLIMDEGNSARQIYSAENAPIRSVVVGIIDEITLAN